jgi:P-type Cu+ transporter
MDDKMPNQSHYQSLIYKTIVATIVGLPLFIFSMLNILPSLQTTLGHFINLLLGLVTVAVLIYSGGHFFVGAWNAFRAHSANMDTLIAVGTAMAWLYSMIAVLFTHYLPIMAQHVYFEASVVIIALVNLGAVLELRARRHTSEAIQRLMRLQPKTARVIRNDEETDEPIESLQVGDLVRVRPGEQIPTDGIIIEGNSSIDESMLTGEPLARQKKKDDLVFGGTLNKIGSFIFKTKYVGKETVLAQIIRLVQQAQNSKPALARLTDQISAIFVPAVLIIAVITAAIWFNVGVEPRAAYMLVTAIAVLIVACPCALGLAVPISVMVGIGKGAEYGILIRHADALQQAGQLTTIVLDKTGTITQGQPQVTDIFPAANSDSKQLITLAASLEAASEHPLAEAIVQYSKERNYSLLKIYQFEAITGLGISGMINEKRILLGNRKLMQNYNIDLDDWEKQGEALAIQAKTPIYVACGQTIVGIIAIGDPIKTDSKKAIQDLHARGLKVIMITGDHPATAKVIALQVGIEDIMAEVSPQEKAGKIAELQAKGQKVGMVGDGINDAPALARAEVGFAMGGGTDVAMESGDITLMRNSLCSIVEAIEISQQTIKNMKQNLFGAFIYNIVGIPIAAGVLFPIIGLLLNPMLAGLAMALSSVTVVINANRLRFLKFKESK